jgi:chemotaxis protein CheD
VKRESDRGTTDHQRRRRASEAPGERLFLDPGHLLIPVEPLGVGVVVTSTVLVTIFDPVQQRGGLCHFVRPRPVGTQRPTPLFGNAAVRALMKEFGSKGDNGRLLVGLYGGACPAIATPAQRKLAAANLDMAREQLQAGGLVLADADVGGDRARKLWYHTGTNELLVLKTTSVRKSDWFPALAQVGGRT